MLDGTLLRDDPDCIPVCYTKRGNFHSLFDYNNNNVR